MLVADQSTGGVIVLTSSREHGPAIGTWTTLQKARDPMSLDMPSDIVSTSTTLQPAHHSFIIFFLEKHHLIG